MSGSTFFKRCVRRCVLCLCLYAFTPLCLPVFMLERLSFKNKGRSSSSWGMNQSTHPSLHRSHFGSRYQSGRCALRSPFMQPWSFKPLSSTSSRILCKMVSFSFSSVLVCLLSFVFSLFTKKWLRFAFLQSHLIHIKWLDFAWSKSKNSSWVQLELYTWVQLELYL